MCANSEACPYLTESCWLFLEVCLVLIVQLQLLSLKNWVFFPCVSYFYFVVNHLVLQNLKLSLLIFSLQQIIWENQVVFPSVLPSSISKGIYYTNLLPREAENNYCSVLCITTLVIDRKTNTLKFTLTT